MALKKRLNTNNGGVQQAQVQNAPAAATEPQTDESTGEVKEVRKDFVNYQGKSIVKKSASGTILLEVVLNMVKKSRNDSNAFLDSKIIINLQNNDKNNKKISSIPYFFTIGEWKDLKHRIDTGYFAQKISLTKLDTLAEMYQQMSGVDFESFYNEYSEARDEIVRLSPGLNLEETNNFLAKYPLNQMPNYEKLIPAYMGGTSAKAAHRPDGKAVARLFEIAPGGKVDLMLTAKTGPGRVSQTGGISIEKVENTLRFPMSYNEFAEMVNEVDMQVTAILSNSVLF